MANISSDKLVVQIKSYARSGPLPLDATSVWETVEAAQEYVKAPNAYGGQIIAALDDGQYKAFMIQSDGPEAYKLSEFPSKNEVQSGLSSIESNISDLQEEVSGKAPIESPEFTGEITLNGNTVATEEYVSNLISKIVTGPPGIVNSSSPIPQTGYKAGQMWRVSEAGSYVGQQCEPGDIILCIADYVDAYKDADFTVLQANITGAVTSSANGVVDGEIVVYDGTSGKVIKSSTISLETLHDVVAKAHEHENILVLDSYDKTQEELLEDMSGSVDEKIGNLGEHATVTEYVQAQIASGGINIGSIPEEDIAALFN